MGLVRTVLICAAFGLSIGKAHGSGSSDHVLVKTPGQSVLFNTSSSPVTSYTYLTWEINPSSYPFTIVTVNGSVTTIFPVYRDRVTLFDDGSLELRNLTLSDSRAYRVNITSTEGPGVSIIYELYVQEPVSDVRISSSATEVTEGYSIRFTCSASGSDPKYTFFNNSHIIPAAFDDIYMNFLSRNSIGPYGCVAYNFLNRVTSSNEINLTINYGPDEVNLEVVPLLDFYTDGSKVTLQCTVNGSKPEAEITWWFGFEWMDQVKLPFNGTDIVLGPLKYEDHGSYECRAYNRKTDRYARRSFYISVEYVSPSGLSDGALVGIAIACIAVVFGTGAIVFYFFKRKN